MSDSWLSIRQKWSLYKGPCLRIHVSASLYLTVLYKTMSLDSCLIFASGDPLQDPCLGFMSQHLHISGSLQDPVLGFMSQHPPTWILTRSTFWDSCLTSLYLRILCKIHDSGSMCPIHVLASTTMDPVQDPCLQIHVSASLFLSILHKIHVFGLISGHLCI